MGGIVISIGTFLYARTNNIDFNKPFPVVLPGCGIAYVAGSIPLFIAAWRNKRKALHATTYLKMEKVSILQQTEINFHEYPTISLKFNF